MKPAAGCENGPRVFHVAGKAFPLVPRVIAAAGIEVTLFEIPYSPAVLDEVAALRGGGAAIKESDWPYWLEDWPATYALADILSADPPKPETGPILDLGCGSGFLSVFLWKKFGRNIFSCDFNADACRLAALNLRAAADGGPQVFCADFSAFPSRLRFGTVFCGDMLYAQANHIPILDFLAAHLAPAGKAFLADPGRSAADGFPGLAVSRGFEVRPIPSRTGVGGLRIFRLTR